MAPRVRTTPTTRRRARALRDGYDRFRVASGESILELEEQSASTSEKGRTERRADGRGLQDTGLPGRRNALASDAIYRI
jgi:hypothetical protein